MENDIKARIDKMTKQEQEKRLAELNEKLGITYPQNLAEDGSPGTVSIEEREEREYLKAKLGLKSPEG